ncbi:MAG: polyphosphate kinase 1 [Flavobacteriaceae bacterium]|nr:polyphosphate kinase 1 [Flavobacteriaceae bacterium]
MNRQVNRYINREISWLEFNERVLQEADDTNVPLIERVRFLGIFSNNLDEFYRVRYATVKRIAVSNDSGKTIYRDVTAKNLLKEISTKAIKLQEQSFKILNKVVVELEKEKIFFVNENTMMKYQKKFISSYFSDIISPSLGIIVLDKIKKMPKFEDNLSFILVKMKNKYDQSQHAILHFPKNLKRFIQLPSNDDNDYVVMVDDIIRYYLKKIFKIFRPKQISAHMIKISRDAELEFDDDISKSYLEKISESLLDRYSGNPVRFVYDSEMSKETLDFIISKMSIDVENDSIVPGGKYHNRSDYMNFPSLGRKNLIYDDLIPLKISGLNLNKGIFKKIAEKDFLLHTPYQKFLYIINFLIEASIDPKVKKIFITIYRLSKLSKVASALINAARNGKKVFVLIELQARFDESANIKYAKEMQSHGIKISYGSQNLKVHSKICVVERKQENGIDKYGFISTGNLNESTAKVYTDMTLFTSNNQILDEVKSVFNFFDANYKKYNFKNLFISPINTATRLKKLIKNEIKNAKKGEPAWIKIKINNITNRNMIKALYDASRNGVKIELIVRGVCCLIPGIKKMSESIKGISIVDRFLEHTRFMIFCDGGNNKTYISSADWMTRNLDNRVEVTCPIFDKEIKDEIMDVFKIYWNDNVKSRFINSPKINSYKKNKNPVYRSQSEVYKYYQEKN